VGLWSNIFGNKKSGATATAPKPAVDPEGVVLGDAKAAEKKKGLLDKFESKVRRKIDGYVDDKADALLDDATKRAEQFRAETLTEVHDTAMKLLDLTEARIDEKLVEIEAMLEKRLREELKMRLRAMLWTLAFVLLMAAVSFAYVWVKRSTGLDNQNTQQE
jgi:vacuolar-type H+-ATPase subunit H